MTNEPEPQAELERLALLYVAGELEEPLRSEFEKRLATDQLAQNAVVETVRLTDGLLQALESENVDLQPARDFKSGVGTRERAAWAPTPAFALLVTAVTMLVAAVAWSFLLSPDPDGSMAEADSVAVAWAEYVQTESDIADADEEEWDDADSLIDIDTASWMAVALSEIETEDMGEDE